MKQGIFVLNMCRNFQRCLHVFRTISRQNEFRQSRQHCWATGNFEGKMSLSKAPFSHCHFRQPCVNGTVDSLAIVHGMQQCRFSSTVSSVEGVATAHAKSETKLEIEQPQADRDCSRPTQAPAPVWTLQVGCAPQRVRPPTQGSTFTPLGPNVRF